MKRGPAEPQRFPPSPSPNLHPPGGIWQRRGGVQEMISPCVGHPQRTQAPCGTHRLAPHACPNPKPTRVSAPPATSRAGSAPQPLGDTNPGGEDPGGGSQRPQPGLCPSPWVLRSACSRFPAAALPPGGATVGSRGQGSPWRPSQARGHRARPPPTPAKPPPKPPREVGAAGIFRHRFPPRAPSPKALHPRQALRQEYGSSSSIRGRKRGKKKTQKNHKFCPQPFPPRGAAPKGLTQPGPILKLEERCSLIPIHSFRDIIIVFMRCNHSIYLRIKLV